MIGPTGVGKTEIARRLARLAQSPFLKVEASKFTEVGYVGRDVESMVRDLVELAVDMVKEERLVEVRGKARQAAEERVLDLLLPPLPAAPDYDDQATSIREQAQRTREKLREQLRDGRLDHKQVEINVKEKSFPSFEIIAGSSVEEVDINVKDEGSEKYLGIYALEGDTLQFHYCRNASPTAERPKDFFRSPLVDDRGRHHGANPCR